MKKTCKVLSVLIITLAIAFACTTVFAGGIDTTVLDTMKGNANIGAAGTTLGNIGNKVLTIITTVGMVASVIIIAVLGIKYMIGSTEEKAEYKKALMPFIVGAILLFGASAIGKAIVGFGTSIVDEPQQQQQNPPAQP